MAEGLANVMKTLDPSKPLGFWFFVISCVIAISVDPLFFERCLRFDRKLRISAIVHYALFGFCYLTCANFLLPSSSSTAPEGKAYLLRFSMIDFLVLFPIPLVLLILIMEIPKMGVTIFLLPMSVFLFQYLVRIIRISVLFTEATKASGILAEAKWTKAAFNLLLYLQGGHVFGGLWYFFAVEREVVFWKEACAGHVTGSRSFYCDDGFQDYKFRYSNCTGIDPSLADFGIFVDALQSRIVARHETDFTFFLERLFYCLRWGVQTLSCFGQNLTPSTYFPENFFVICITIYAVFVLAYLVGNMQTYLQSETMRSEELRLQGRESEQWMPFWNLSEKLQKDIKKLQPYKWLETKTIHAEDLLNKLPKDLQRNIKCELCLDLLRKVGEFGNLSEGALESLCNELKAVSFSKRTVLAREGDPVEEMVIVVQGKLRRSSNGCQNRLLLKDGEIWGKELVTWVHADPRSRSCLSHHLLISPATITAITDVEAFVVMVEDLQHVFEREQAARFIQSFWRFTRVLHSRKRVQIPV